MKKKKKMGETITASSTESSTLTVDSSTLSGTVSSSGSTITTVGSLSSSGWSHSLSSASMANPAGSLYYMDFDPWQKIEEVRRPLTDEELDRVVEKVLDKEEDFMPIFRRYLTKYLDGILDDPSELVKDVIKEKDKEINRLRDQVGQLEEKLKSLSDKVDRIDSLGRPLGGWGDLAGSSITWSYDDSTTSPTITSTTTTSDYLNSAANTYEYSTLKSMLANANTNSSTDSSA